MNLMISFFLLLRLEPKSRVHTREGLQFHPALGVLATQGLWSSDKPSAGWQEQGDKRALDKILGGCCLNTLISFLA